MSGRPKKSLLTVSIEIAERLRKEAERKAVLEKKKAIEAQRQAQLQMLRNETKKNIKELDGVINKLNSIKTITSKNAIDNECKKIREELQLVQDMAQLNSLNNQIRKLNVKIESTIRDEKISEKTDKLIQEIKDTQKLISTISSGHSQKYDAGKRDMLEKQLNQFLSELNKDNVSTLNQPINQCILDSQTHIENVNNAYLKHKSIAQSNLLNLSTRMEKLLEDKVTYKWHYPRIAEKQKEMQNIDELFLNEDYDDVIQKVEDININIDTLIKEAIELEVKAQERDYIAKSIADSLAEMGFVSSEFKEESKGHPKTRLLIQAKKNTGEGINIGVPYEGDVMYEVGGYSMHTEAKVGGGSAKACDKAETMLKEMSKKLNEKYKIKSSKITWEGQDPNRVLKNAEQLPKSNDASRSDQI